MSSSLWCSRPSQRREGASCFDFLVPKGHRATQPPTRREAVRPATLTQVSQPEAEALQESGPPSRWVSEASQPTEHLCLGRVVERLGALVPAPPPFRGHSILAQNAVLALSRNQDGLSAFVGGPESEPRNQS